MNSFFFDCFLCSFLLPSSLLPSYLLLIFNGKIKRKEVENVLISFTLGSSFPLLFYIRIGGGGIPEVCKSKFHQHFSTAFPLPSKLDIVFMHCN